MTAITPRLVDAVIDYDRAFFPAPRLNFLRCWLTTKQHRGMVILENGAVRGYGVVRPCRQGFKIGPLFANSVDRADLLFCALAQQADHAPIFLDCPEPNVSATELALKYGLSPVFETARMYRGQEPVLPLARIFGITTFELG